MSDFRLKHPFSIELEFDSERVTREKLGELLATLNPGQVTEYPHLGLADHWAVAPIHEGLSILSPVFPASNESLDHLSAAIALLNFEGYSQEFSSPISLKNSFFLNVGVADLTLMEVLEVVRAAHLIEPAIKTLLPASRYNHRSCKFLHRFMEEPPSSLRHLTALTAKEAAVSIFKYLPAGMLQVRYFSGTSNINKVMFWLLLWCSVIDRTVLEGPPEGPLDTFDKIANWLRWPTEGQGPQVMARGFFANRVRSLREARARRGSAPAGANSEG